MANQEHLKILEDGIDVWNDWRGKNYNIKPDLSGAGLSGTDLSGVCLRKANVIRASLSYAKLKRADLSGADFGGADLSEANFYKADLSRANFYKADLSGTNLSGANITGANLYLTFRDYWTIKDIQCDYIFWDAEGKERTPKERNFRPGEFEELYKWRPLNDFERLILRSIEFSEEYFEAGKSILSYFGTILRKRYPETKANVQIKQDGLKVTMIIETPEGEKSVIEKELDKYGMVITGKMTPEEYTEDKFLVLELKNELRIAHHRIESQKELLQITKEDYNHRIKSLEEDVQWFKNHIAGVLQHSDKAMQIASDNAHSLKELFLRLIEKNADISTELNNLQEKLSIISPTQTDIQEVKAILLSLRDKKPSAYQEVVNIFENILLGTTGSVCGTVIIEAIKLIG